MPDLDDADAFAAFLRMLKHRSGRSYQALAARLGVSDSALQRYCSGRQLPPRHGIVERLARECGADRDELSRALVLWSRADAARTGARVAAADRGGAGERPAPRGAEAAAVDRSGGADPPGRPAAAPGRRRLVIAALVTLALLAGLVVWLGTVGSTRRAATPEAASCANLIGNAGMAAWWRLDEERTTTDAADSSGRGVGAARSADADPVPGRFGRAVHFTGGVLGTERPVVATEQSFTVSAWVRLESTVDWATAISQDGDRASGFFLQYSYDDEKWSFAMVDADADNAKGTRALSASRPVKEWTHLVGVHDAAAGRLLLYVNGRLEGDVEVPPPWRADGPLVIGRAKWNGMPSDRWRGDIDEVCVFTTALGADDVRALSGG
jgi:transcriptional regulator with XRE-family HTH domain